MPTKQAISVNAQTLSAIKIFSPVSLDVREKIAPYLKSREYLPNEQIIGQEDASHDAFFVVTGKVRVTYYSNSGKEIAFRELQAGLMFGEISAIDDQSRSAQVVALENTCIARISNADFLRIIYEYPELTKYVMCHLTKLIRLLSDRVVEFSTLGVKNRIHAELLRLAREYNTKDNQVTIQDFPTHADIASRISTHREAVTRELNELVRANLISKVDGCLKVCDLDRLESLVEDVAGEARRL